MLPRLTSILVTLLAATGGTSAFATDSDALRVGTAHALFWIDEYRVLFVAPPDAVSGTEEPRGMRLRGSYIAKVLDTRTHMIADHARLTGTSRLCFSNGIVAYEKLDPASARSYFVYGKFGEETEFFGAARNDRPDEVYSTLRCRYIDTSPFPPRPSQVIPLLENHGYIVIQYRLNADGQLKGDEAQLILYSPETVDRKELHGYYGADAINLLQNSPHYASWKGAYFNFTPGAFDALPNRAWWLFPDGKIETLTVPKGPWNDFGRTNAGFFPTRAGLLIMIGHPRYDLLFLRGDLVKRNPQLTSEKRLINGIPWAVAISPGGCRVAVAEGARQSRSSDTAELRVVDVCR